MIHARLSYRVILPGLSETPAAGRQKKFFWWVLENTKNVFCIFHRWILEILEKCSEILEIFEKCSEILEKYKNTYKDFCIFLGLPQKKFFWAACGRPP
jgi:hypothetical protein